MKTAIISLVGGLAAATLLAAGPTAPTPTETGKVLVLENGALMEGDIARIGDRYRIACSGGERWVPAAGVVRLVQDRHQAYLVMASRANLRDADERLRLANWCLGRGMRKEALVEARAAVKLRPRFAEAQRMAVGLEQALRNAPDSPGGVVQAQATEVVPEPGAVPPEFNSESFALFVTKVQPILMNTCASCHASDKGGGFKLVRVFDVGANRRATQHNLSVALAQLSRERVLGSPLLAKAISAHGNLNQPPIKNRQAAAYRLLETWARFALLPEGSGPPEPLGPSATATVEFVPPGGTQAAEPGRLPASVTDPGEFGTDRQSGAPPVRPMPMPGAAPMPGQPPKPPADPFDPAIFNNQPGPK